MHRLQTYGGALAIEYAALASLVALESVGCIYVYCRFGGIYREGSAAARLIEYGCWFAHVGRMAQQEGVVVAVGDGELFVVTVYAFAYLAWLLEVKWCALHLASFACDVLVLVIFGISLAVYPQVMGQDVAVWFARDVEE